MAGPEALAAGGTTTSVPAPCRAPAVACCSRPGGRRGRAGGRVQSCRCRTRHLLRLGRAELSAGSALLHGHAGCRCSRECWGTEQSARAGAGRAGLGLVAGARPRRQDCAWRCRGAEFGCRERFPATGTACQRRPSPRAATASASPKPSVQLAWSTLRPAGKRRPGPRHRALERHVELHEKGRRPVGPRRSRPAAAAQCGWISARTSPGSRGRARPPRPWACLSW
jgi:hypothetical protein